MRLFLIVVVLMLVGSLIAETNTTESIYPAATNTVSEKSVRQTYPQCEATTLSGNRCKRRATHGSHYCRQHAAIIHKRKKNKNDEGTKNGRSSYGNAIEREKD